MTITIKRPTVVIRTNERGVHTFVVTSEAWMMEYFRTNTSSDLGDVKKRAKAFTNQFNKEATAIETGSTKPYNIMGTWMQNGYFRSRRKAATTTINF